MNPVATSTQAKTRGRPASFCRDELIKTVTDLFWLHGYAKLSFNQIALATGLTRASLYNAFENKEALFLECMDYYNATSPLRLLDDCGAGDKIGPVLYKALEQLSEIRARDKSNRGCLAANTFSELAASDTRLGAVVVAAQARKNARMVRLVKQAIHQNELPADTDAETTAQIIMAFMIGLSAQSKTGASKSKLSKMSQTFLQRIGFANAPG